MMGLHIMLQVMHHSFIHDIGAAGNRFQRAAATDDGIQVSQFEPMAFNRLFDEAKDFDSDEKKEGDK